MHYHHCPECYEAKPCEMLCTMEPELEDPVSHPGKTFGAHCICDDCSLLKARDLNKEWWLRYNGFIK